MHREPLLVPEPQLEARRTVATHVLIQGHGRTSSDSSVDPRPPSPSTPRARSTQEHSRTPLPRPSPTEAPTRPSASSTEIGQSGPKNLIDGPTLRFTLRGWRREDGQPPLRRTFHPPHPWSRRPLPGRADEGRRASQDRARHFGQRGRPFHLERGPPALRVHGRAGGFAG